MCSVLKKDDEDGEITVQGLRLRNEKGTEFVVHEGDTFNISVDSVVEKLSEPKLLWKNRVITYKFSKPVDVYEKK